MNPLALLMLLGVALSAFAAQAAPEPLTEEQRRALAARFHAQYLKLQALARTNAWPAAQLAQAESALAAQWRATVDARQIADWFAAERMLKETV